MMARKYILQGYELEAIWLEEKDLPINSSTYANYYGDLRYRVNFMYSEILERRCPVCNKYFSGFELHHAIVSKQDVRGWPRQKKRLIDTEVNLIPLHPECHKERPPTRTEAWKYLCGIYGETIVKEWYEGLPFKSAQENYA